MILYPKPPKRVKKPKRLKAKGKKVDAWEVTREFLKVRFALAGITLCELRYEGCTVNNFLSFAHSKKRRYITSQEELEEVIIACQSCHARIEYSQNMYQIVRGVIASRRVKV